MSKLKKNKELKLDTSLEKVDWDDLAYDLINLEFELFFLRDELKKDDIKLYEDLIESCENEKSRRIKEKCDHSFLEACAQTLPEESDT